MSAQLNAFSKCPIRAKGDPACPLHRDMTVTSLCRYCTKLVCVKCKSSEHAEHLTMDLHTAVSKKKCEIQQYTSQKANIKLSQLQQIIKLKRDEFKKIGKTLDDTQIEIRENRKAIKQNLDQISDEWCRTCERLKQQNTHALDELQSACATLEHYIQASRKLMLQEGSDVLIYDTDIGPYTNTTTMPIPVLSTAVFTPSVNRVTLLEQAFGVLKTSETLNESADEKTDKNVDVTTCGKDCKKMPKPDTKLETIGIPTPPVILENKETASPEAKVDSEESLPPKVASNTKQMFDFEARGYTFHIHDISPESDQSTWVCYRESSMVAQLDRKGAVLKEIECEGVVNGISVSPTTGRLWVCVGRSVYEITSSGASLLRFYTDADQTCLCLSHDSRVIVGMLNSTIGVYNTRGVCLKTAKQRGSPLKVAECPVTGNTAVVLSTAANKMSGLSILNKKMEEIGSFDLNIDGNSLNPRDVTYDVKGNALVAAVGLVPHRCHLFLLLDNRGSVKRVLGKHSSERCSSPLIGVDKVKCLWIVSHRDQTSPQRVQALQY
ncbi:uncharacterized protein LOC110459800 [Mizuhopecten yessoensis]|uniref:uncharacterized protein LOC110459800 n=1 Tax=Mizuhopecten yessoensis TaxID=6573 RepID=UPI000B459789|nr:uncharacterized protein LOC110459800 [Mizuhopecten yessoensis]